MLLGQGLEDRFLGTLPSDDGTVGLDHDVSSLGPLDDVVTGQPRVYLPLADVDRAPDAGGLYVVLELVQVVDAVVGDADGADPALLLGLGEGPPGAAPGLLPAVGGVDQVQVDVVEARLEEGRLDGFLGLLVAHGPRRDFAREEDLLPLQTRRPDRVGARLFVAVRPGRVHVSVARLEGVQDHRLAVGGGGVVDPVPQRRDLVARVHGVRGVDVELGGGGGGLVVVVVGMMMLLMLMSHDASLIRYSRYRPC